MSLTMSRLRDILTLSLPRLRAGPWAAGGMAALLIAAGIAQQWIVRHPHASPGPALIVLAVCGMVAAALLAAAPVAGLATLPVTASVPRAWRPLAVAACAGVTCAVVSARLVGTDPWNAQWWWLGAMASSLLIALATSLRPWRAAAFRDFAYLWREGAVLAGLFLLALAVRVPHITSSPPFVHGDEAMCGIYGRLFAAGHTPLLSIQWFGLPMLSYAVSGAGMQLFGNNLTGLRLTNAVIGSLAVVLTYLLGKEWFGRRAGLLGALVLSVTFLHVLLSRDGIHYLQGPTCITLSLYLCTVWLKRGGALTALLAGMSLILDLQVYWSARAVVVPAGALFLAFWFGQRRIVWLRGRELGWFGVGIIVSGLPLAALFLSVSGSFAGHQNEVSIFDTSPVTAAHLRSLYGSAGLGSMVLQQAWRVLTTFNATGDSSTQIAWDGSMLDWISAALLPAALVLAMRRWRRWPYLVCLAWIGTVLGAGILTLDPPWWPRLSALLPAVALLLGVLLDDVGRFLQRRWTLDRPAEELALTACVAALLLGMAYANLRTVYVTYPALTNQNGLTARTLLGNFLSREPMSGNTVLLSDSSTDMNYATIRFLAPRSGGCTLPPGAPLRFCPNVATSRLFVVLPGNDDLALLERARPGGRTVLVGTYNYGLSNIMAYELPARPHKS